MSYYGFVVTDSGRELIAKLVAGKQLPISKIMVGSGTIPDDVKPAAMTALVEPVAAGTSTAPVYDGASVRMIVEYRSDLNGGLDHGFWLREFGVFAGEDRYTTRDSERLLRLPLYYEMTGEESAKVIESVHDFFRQEK